MKSHKQGHTPLIRNKKCMICLLFQRPQAVILHTIHLISNSRKIQDGVGKTLVHLNEKTWSQMVVPGHMAHVGGVVWGVLRKG